MNELDYWWASPYEGKWAICVMTCWKPRTAHIKALCEDKAMAEQIVREHNIVRDLKLKEEKYRDADRTAVG